MFNYGISFFSECNFWKKRSARSFVFSPVLRKYLWSSSGAEGKNLHQSDKRAGDSAWETLPRGKRKSLIHSPLHIKPNCCDNWTWPWLTYQRFYQPPLSWRLNRRGRKHKWDFEKSEGWTCRSPPQWRRRPSFRMQKQKRTHPKMSAGIILRTVAQCEPRLRVHLSTLGQTELNPWGSSAESVWVATFKAPTLKPRLSNTTDALWPPRASPGVINNAWNLVENDTNEGCN